MANYSQLNIVVNNGSGGSSTITIPLPGASTSSLSPEGAVANQPVDWQGIAMTIGQKTGFVDPVGVAYYPPAAIIKVSPT
jgi:hypothetical protein